MFSIFIFLTALEYCSSQIFASGTLNHTILVWNKTESYLNNTQFGKSLRSLEYDNYNKIILAGCKEKSILLWNILNNTERVIDTTVSVDAIISLNSTHFMIGSINITIIYKISDKSFKNFADNFGIISDMKLLKNDNLVLIATNSSKIVVFDLITHKKVFNQMNTVKIVSIDCLNKSFIVAQCYTDSLCIFGLNEANYLNLIKTSGFGSSLSIFFSIKIYNESSIIYGIEGTSAIRIWNPTKQTQSNKLTENPPVVIDIIGDNSVSYGQNNRKLKWGSLNGSENKYQSSNLIYFLKTIEYLKIENQNSSINTNFFQTTVYKTNNYESTTVYSIFTQTLETNKKLNYQEEIQYTTNLILNEIKNSSDFKFDQVNNSIINYVNFFNQDINLLLDLMKSKIDLNVCLVNCSGNGRCKLIDKSFYQCECFENYSGLSCELNALACYSNPCKNNGTCVISSNDKRYKCECFSENNQTSLYYGHNCENKIDVCLNETCSSNGVCYDKNNRIKCQCFMGYSGEKCQFESNELKVKKIVIKMTSIIAFIIIGLYFLILILFDVSNLICPKPIKRRKIKFANPKKLNYKN